MPYEKFFSPSYGNYRGKTRDHSLDYYRIGPVYTLFHMPKTHGHDADGSSSPSDWILSQGAWNDNNFWRDQAKWIG